MKFSEAIRLGAMSTGQCFGVSYNKVNGDVTETCALGAAMHAIGGIGEKWPVEWNWAYDTLAYCPMGCSHPYGWEAPCVLMVTAHLNDGHKWSRERVADYVESMELKHAPSFVAATVEHESARTDLPIAAGSPALGGVQDEEYTTT